MTMSKIMSDKIDLESKYEILKIRYYLLTREYWKLWMCFIVVSGAMLIALLI